ncbi:MAG: DUF2934 domain-containing protein [Proteobacteria bacterium]|nr:DUF2934 domain-containing protein [Pseudomonadota bacterium]
MDDEDRQERIRQRAYQLWLSDGCPEGRELQHWLAAERTEAEAEDQAADEASKESFPASDPPARTAVAGTA